MKGHVDEVLTLALSGDGAYLASAGKDRRVGVWDVVKAEWVTSFGGHKDTISVSPRRSLSMSSPTFIHRTPDAVLPQRYTSTIQRVV